MIKYILTIFLILITLGCAHVQTQETKTLVDKAFNAAYENNPPKIEKDIKWSGVNFWQSAKGKKTWELKAGEVWSDSNKEVFVFEKVSAKLYTDNGKVIEITARKGVYYRKTGKIIFYGDVRGEVRKK